MPFPKHNRFVVRGEFGSSVEIWSNSLHFTSEFEGAPDNQPQDWDEGDVTDAVNAFYSSALFADSCYVTGWRGYQIGADGRLIGDNIKIVEYDTRVPGSGTTRYPPQVALVMSLWASSRGPAQHGRLFLPGPARQVRGATCDLSSGDTTEYLAAFKTYVEALKDAMFGLVDTGEALLNVSKVGTGHKQEVSEYRCGQALDTVRTRRNKVPEAYTVLAA